MKTVKSKKFGLRALSKISLTRGMVTIVDAENYEKLSKFKWYSVPCHGECYAARCGFIDGKKKTIYMHRHILGTIKSKLKTDHINGNGLDNRIFNLRICTQAENLRNQSKKNGNNPYKGVFQIKKSGRWQAHIQVNHKRFNLGIFKTSEEAARAYNEGAIKHHGEFAKLNSEIK